ncbi:hypothetical protein O9993_03905 [Vibrio lentus]|nr:hypothetical protein [Vibrio lentus]
MLALDSNWSMVCQRFIAVSNGVLLLRRRLKTQNWHRYQFYIENRINNVRFGGYG